MPKRLRVLLYEVPDDPYMNLAFEEAFARARGAGVVEDDTLRIWRNANAVVIGYFQYAEEEVHLDRVKEIGAKVVRRFTGGGAVYHDLGNLNYAIAVKPAEPVEDAIEFLYGKLLEGALKALRYLGVEPRVENVNDVVVGDRKISGTAATTSWGVYFLHGALLVATDLQKLTYVLKVPREKLLDKRISSIKYRVARLVDILGRSVSTKELVEAFVRGYEEVLGAEAYFDMPTSEEVRAARTLYKRYTDPEWNFKRKSMREYREVEEELAEVLRPRA